MSVGQTPIDVSGEKLAHKSLSLSTEINSCHSQAVKVMTDTKNIWR